MEPVARGETTCTATALTLTTRRPTSTPSRRPAPAADDDRWEADDRPLGGG
jgi:hypothetical protein